MNQRAIAFVTGGIAGLVIAALYVLAVREIAGLPSDGRILRAPGSELFAAASYKGLQHMVAFIVLPGAAAIGYVGLVAAVLRQRAWLPIGALTGLAVASYPIAALAACAGGLVATTLGSKALGFATMWLYGGAIGGLVCWAFRAPRSSPAMSRSN